jgi:hypothetical protein
MSSVRQVLEVVRDRGRLDPGELKGARLRSGNEPIGTPSSPCSSLRKPLAEDLPEVAAAASDAWAALAGRLCPTGPVDAVIEGEGGPDVVRTRCGLVPSWWPKPLKDLKAATFNAHCRR